MGRSWTSGVLRGASWSTLTQVVPVAVSVFLTPLVIGSFGLERFGLFLVCGTLIAFVATFDGGLGASASRYLAVFAASDDRVSSTRLVTSLIGLLAGLGVSMCAVTWLAAPVAIRAFGISTDLQGEGIYLLRMMGTLTLLAQLRSLFAALLAARQLYGWAAFSSFVSYAIYLTGMVLTIETGWGLRGVAWTFLAQSLAATVLIVPKGWRYLDLAGAGLWSRQEYLSFLRYALPVQLNGLISIFNSQADAIIVGRLVSVPSVGIYGAGANFASQLRGLPSNALAPITIALSQAHGGANSTDRMATFARVQRNWVQFTSAWCAVAVGAVYFGIVSWLGPAFELAGVVAVVLMVSHAVNLWTGALTSYLHAIGRPGLETRYVTLSVVLNVSLTIPLVILFGVIGTVVATAFGATVSSLYLLYVVRRQLGPDVPMFLRDVPVAAVTCTIPVVLGLELIARPLVPTGPLGLLTCGALAAPGFVVFAYVLLGRRRVMELALATLSRLNMSHE